MGSTFGSLFRVTTWGESHGPAIGVVIDGCPPGLAIDESDLQADLDRRRPGQSDLTTPRSEADRARILSGVLDGKTTGTPISIMVENQDARSRDYKKVRQAFRPSHADFTYAAKYGIRDHRGGGRASARETIGRVAAAAIARKLLARRFRTKILAYVVKVHEIVADVDPDTVTARRIESNAVRCPDRTAAAIMTQRIRDAADAGDSVGGIVECIARSVPAGLGEPVFDKLTADLARAMMSLPATRGFEVGEGFAATDRTGFEHNDPFTSRDGKVAPATNRAGGILGGISSGETIRVRVAFKPTSTVSRPQETVDTRGRKTTLEVKGRHDPCVLPRAVPIVEAMMALTLVDHLLRHEAQCGPLTSQERSRSGSARAGKNARAGKKTTKKKKKKNT